MKKTVMSLVAVSVWLAAAAGRAPVPLNAQQAQAGPKYQIDPSWPKPLPEGWIIGRTGYICADSHDHLIVTNRRDITAEEAETSQQAPSILIFDLAGNLVDSWGTPATVPTTIHGCFADKENNIWLTGNGDGVVQKWAHDGSKLLMQVGKKGVYDTTDGTAKGTALNASHEGFFNPAAVVVDPANGDFYVADGYGNRRIAVFDSKGTFLRQWGRQATPEETQNGVAGAFAALVHCVTMGNDGLIYVCDRSGDRLQVFDKMGNFKKNIWVRTGTPTLPDPRGTVWSVQFSRDPGQKYMFVMNGRNEQVHIMDHASGEILSSFGRPGHWLGNFTHGHALALDSKGNIYVAETDTGRRMQKFSLVN